MEFSRPECRSGQPFPPPGDLPNPGMEPRSPALQADSLPAEPPGKPLVWAMDNCNMKALTLQPFLGTHRGVGSRSPTTPKPTDAQVPYVK